MGALLPSSCIYELPIATEPVLQLDECLVRTWIAGKPANNVEVRKFDAADYNQSSDGELQQPCHPDVAGMPFVSIRSMNPLKRNERNYRLVSYEVRDDAGTLIVRSVNRDVVSDTAKSEAVQRGDNDLPAGGRLTGIRLAARRPVHHA